MRAYFGPVNAAKGWLPCVAVAAMLTACASGAGAAPAASVTVTSAATSGQAAATSASATASSPAVAPAVGTVLHAYSKSDYITNQRQLGFDVFDPAGDLQVYDAAGKLLNTLSADHWDAPRSMPSSSTRSSTCSLASPTASPIWSVPSATTS